MEIFVTNKFLDKLTEFRKKAFLNEDEKNIFLSSKLARFLNSNINLVTNITEEEVELYAINNFGKKEYVTVKDAVIHKIIKNGYDYDDLTAISEIDCKSYLFVDNTCHAKVNNGIIELNFDKQKQEFYLNSTVTQRTFKNEYQEISQFIPTCNCMLYIDPYLVEGNETDRKNKNENFIKLIRSFIKRDLNVKFQLTIITKLGQWDYKTNKFVIVPNQNIRDLVSNLQKIENFEFEIYLAENLHFGSDLRDRFRDRIYYTNYTKGSFGHPNDGKTTYFNQNFMAISTDINKDYDDYLRELKLWFNFINRIPSKKFGTDTKHGNLLNGNRLFDSLA